MFKGVLHTFWTFIYIYIYIERERGWVHFTPDVTLNNITSLNIF